MSCVFFFFFKQKTAYEMRISDWSSTCALPILFPAALLGRLIVVPYYSLPDSMLAQIVVLQLERIRARLMDNHQVQMTVQPEVIDLIVERCTEIGRASCRESMCQYV